MIKFCQGCSTPFHCQESVDCWCNKKLFKYAGPGAKGQNFFSTDGLGCYCPACLDDILEAGTIEESDTLHI